MRTVSSGAQTALSARQVTLALLVEMFLTDVIRVNSSPVTIAWGGYDWLGAGALGSVEELKDAPGERKPLQFSLSGVPSDQLALALSERVRNKRVNVYLAVLDQDTQEVLDAPIMWTGTLAQMPIEQTPATCTVAVTAMHAIETMSRAKPVRYTDADQQRLYPGDTSNRFVISQSQHTDIWPAASFGRR